MANRLPNPMPPTPTETEEAKRVNDAIQRLQERGALKDEHCPRCRVFDWHVDFIAIPSVPLPNAGLNLQRNVVMHVGISSASSYIPALTLVCRNCGNTIIHNLKMLGLLEGGER
jgi:hypothetical protein